MSRLQISDIPSLRANSAPLPLTVAPATSSEHFNSPHTRGKPLAQRWDYHFSIESRSFNGSAFKKGASPVASRKIISLGTGRPKADYYPWEGLSMQAMSLVQLESKGYNGEGRDAVQTVTKHDSTYNLSLGLNYGHAAGSPHLLRFLTEHIELVHNPPYRGWRTFLSCGSTAAFEFAFRIFCNRGDSVLVERYTYAGALESIVLNGARPYGVNMDADGLLPDALEEVLSSWELSQGPKPRVLYTIPTGQNPTGFSQPEERREAIYKSAEKHDLIIIEDDPYYFLRMGPCEGVHNGEETVGISNDMFNTYAESSYLSLDTSGRVVRLDSTSKILAPGLRAGWVTASEQIIEKFLAYQEVSTVAVSGPSQIMLWNLLDITWGHDGFKSWLVHLSSEYQRRRDILLRACEKYVPSELAEWVPPRYGMFLWIKVHWRRHPVLGALAETLTTEEMDSQLQGLESRIATRALEDGALVAKGSLFSWDKKPGGQLHFRMTFAAADKGDLKEGVKLFANALKREFASGLS